MGTENLDRLGDTLFGSGRRVTAADFKVVTGPAAADADAETLAGTLLASMERMGLVRDGELVDPNVREAAEAACGARNLGIADYLEQFDSSPYVAPPSDGYRSVEGVSTLKGSWFQGKGSPA